MGAAKGRDGLTDKQREFADALAEGLTQTDAYRRVYAVTNEKAEWICEEARRLAERPEVAQRVDRVREAARHRTVTTVETLTQKLWDVLKMAEDLKNPAAATGAITALAKINGLMIDKTASAVTLVDSTDLDTLRRQASEAAARIGIISQTQHDEATDTGSTTKH